MKARTERTVPGDKRLSTGTADAGAIAEAGRAERAVPTSLYSRRSNRLRLISHPSDGRAKDGKAPA